MNAYLSHLFGGVLKQRSAYRLKTLGLALGAGGSRGVAHIGFLQGLENEGIKPDFIAGSSMGAVVGSAYAAGTSTKIMWEAIKELRLRDLLAPSGLKGGLFSLKGMRAQLEKYVGGDFRDLKIPFACVAVDMHTQSLVEFREGDLLDAVLASSCIPAVFQPLEKNGMRLIDGGILERVPVSQVKQLGADVTVCVDVLGWLPCTKNRTGAIGTLLQTYELMDNYRTDNRRKANEKIIDFWLEPELGEMSPYSLKEIAMAYEKGYELAKANTEKIKKRLRG